jgi:hypothetical protein
MRFVPPPLGSPARGGVLSSVLPCLLWLAAGSGVVVAQDPEPRAEGVPEEVLTLLRRGVEARLGGDDVHALEAFEAAHALAPTLGRAAAQLGLARQALGEWVAAEALLVEALGSDDPWIGRHRSALDQALVVVRAHTATLLVTAPEGTLVALDGAAERIPAPASFRVAEGPHRILGTLAGHDDAALTVEVRGGGEHTVLLTPRATAVVEPAPLPPEPLPAPAPDVSALTPAERPPHALVWAGLGASLVGLGAALGGHLLAEDARAGRAAVLADACEEARAECAALRERLGAELVPYEVVVNASWGLAALGGVLAGLGVGLTLVEGPQSERVWLDPLGLRGAF